MKNKTLILSTTKAVGKDGLFSKSNKNVEKFENQEIYRIKDELIFARSLIIKGNEDKELTLVEIDQEILDFTIQVIKEENIQEVATIIYFIHAKELGINDEYKVLDKGDSRIKNLEAKLKKELTKKIGLLNVKFVAYKHGLDHFWSDFLYEDLEKKEPKLSWVDNIQEFFDERYFFDEGRRKVIEVDEVNNFIKKSVQNVIGTGIYDYSFKIFEENKIDINKSEIKKQPDFQVVYASCVTFSNPKYLNTLGEEIILSKKKIEPLPTVIIGEYDLMGDWSKLENVYKSITINELNIDKRYRFFDSSIWVRYVSKKKNQLGESLEQQLERVINEIKNHLENKTYETNVAKEYIEYHYRLFKNSYLSDEIGGGHARDVTPFMFHSETYMQNEANILFEKFCTDQISWNLLLVDDFADKKLNIGDPQSDNCSFSIQSKKKIIEALFDENKKNKHKVFEFSTAVTVDAAVKELEKKSGSLNYDAILLDYLFSSPNPNDKAKYGTELLMEITKNQNLKKAKAFNYKFWIYPVSVFSDALHSSLREQGVQHLEEDWVLGRGADPINTPQLFRYDFLDFIKVQYDGILFETKDLIDLLLSAHIEENENGPIDVRRWARRFYHILWTKFGKSQSLVYDSLFTRSVNKKREPYNDRKAFMIFEYLETILHNLAFASIFDFEGTEMTYLRLYEELMAACNDDDKKGLREQLKKLGEGIYGIHQ